MIVLYGQFFYLGGLGNDMRASVRALEIEAMSLHTVNMDLNHRPWLDPAACDGVEVVAARRGFGTVAVLHMESPADADWSSVAPVARLPTCVFETLGLPPSWVAPLSAFGRVVVPGTFHAYAAAGVDRLGVAPFAVDTAFFAAGTVSARDCCLRFLTLSIWDIRKTLERLVDVVCTDFPGHDDAGCAGIFDRGDVVHSVRPFLQRTDVLPTSTVSLA